MAAEERAVGCGDNPPFSTCESMKSDDSMDIPIDFSKEDADRAIHAENSNVPPSPCRAMKSDDSMRDFYDFSNVVVDSSVHSELSNIQSSSSVSMKSGDSMNIPNYFHKEDPERAQHDYAELREIDGNALFKSVEKHANSILQSELNRYERMLFPHSSQEGCGLTLEDKKQDNSASDGALKIALYVLKEMGQGELANILEKDIYGELDVCQRKLRQRLKEFEYIYEGVAQHGSQTPLNKVYTELYITEGLNGGVNKEHEVRQIEAAIRRRATEDKPIKCEDIFKPQIGQDGVIRTVLTKGISGIGKTISVYKFNLEWAEGRVNQDIQLLINLPFRELNLMKAKEYTLIQLLHHFLSEAKESGISDFGKYKLVLVFDGLDECRLPLDFDRNEPFSSVSAHTSVDILLTNLIKGNLLPSAHIWLTSRPGAADRIPADLVDRVTEIRGFNNPQKEEYFRKKISDQNMASRVISHVKSTKSLHIMCHIPVFSWLSATVLQRIFQETDKKTKDDGESKEMPTTLTQMYTNFLVYNSLIKIRKYSRGEEPDTQSKVKIDEEMILKLGKLAFEHLMKGNMIFYENELKEFNISIDDAAVYSGVFTQISETDFRFHLERVYCFVHLSMQEFFAAMYVFHTFTCLNQNLLASQEPATVQEAPSEVTSVLKSAVDEALQSENGHLDLFLRFLLGLSQMSNQTLLKSVLHTMKISPPRNEEIVEYIKDKIRENHSPERFINLFHCLGELNDQSLLKEIENYLNTGGLSETRLSPSQWSALVFVLLTSKEEFDEFDLRKYSRSDEGFLRMLPVIKESRRALLSQCHLTDKCCEALGALVGSSCLKELDLSDNYLQDSGVELLSAGLTNPMCQLEKLRLPFCGITEIGCDFLVRALRSNPTHLKELDLSYNYPGQRGVELLSSVQRDTEHLTVCLTGNAECYLKSALRKYACDLTMEPDTAHSHLTFSDDNKKMTRQEAAQPYPDNPERFIDWGQVLCNRGLSGRCYWEVEWTGEWTGLGVTYKGIDRKAKGNDSVIGYNDLSWSLRYCNGKYSACYNKSDEAISNPYFKSKRVGVFLDWPAGSLSFYAVSSNAMTHLHTFHTKFSETVFPAFRLGYPDTVLTLCDPDILEQCKD